MNRRMSGGVRGSARTFKGLLDTSHQRSSRILLIVLLLIVPALICVLIGLLWGAWGGITNDSATGWQALFALAALLVMMAAVSPFVRIWPLNVPDNEVWMILDSTDHLIRFVEAGLHWIKPIQGFQRFGEKGPIPIVVDLEHVVTRDYFPYHVTITITAILNPMAAQPSAWTTLRNLTRDGIASGIKHDIVDMVKQETAKHGRGQIDPRELMETFREAVRDAVAGRSALGVSLAPGNSVKINMEPPKEVIESRKSLWQEEANAKARFNNVVELLNLSGAHGMTVNDLGRLHFLLNPQSGVRVNLQGGSDLFAAPRNIPTLPELPVQLPVLEATTSPVSTEQPTPVSSPPPVPPTPPSQSDVIETEQDENGTFVPSNPILRRKTKPPQNPPTA